MLTDGGETSWLSRSLSFLNSTPCPPEANKTLLHPRGRAGGRAPAPAQGGRRTPRAPTRPPRRLRREAVPSDSAGCALNASLRRGFISRQGPGRMYKSRVWFRGVPSARRARVGRRPALSPPGRRPRPARGGVLLHLPLTTLLAGRAPERGGTPRPTAWNISLEARSARARVRDTPSLGQHTAPEPNSAAVGPPGPELDGAARGGRRGQHLGWNGSAPLPAPGRSLTECLLACLLVCFKSHRCSND